MTEARRLLPNQAHAISRRTSQRRFFLVPTDFCKRVVAYAFAVANEDYPTVQIHVLVAMSNHIEIVASDAHGPDEDSQLPRFFRDAHALIASAMNHHYGRGEHFWAPGSYRNTEIHDLPALADRLVYALANPAAADLVETLADWPGLHFGPELWTEGPNGAELTFERPEGAFFHGGRKNALSTDPTVAPRQRDQQRQEYAADLRAARQADRDAGLTKEEARQAAARRRKNRKREKARERDRTTLPDEATLRIVAPPSYRGREAEMAAEILSLLERREAEHRRERQRKGRGVRGAKAVQAMSPSFSPGDTEPNYDLSPTVACKSRKKRKQVLKCLVGWRRRYRESRKAWPDERKPFPLGTYQMARDHDAEIMSEAECLEEGLIYTPTGPPDAA